MGKAARDVEESKTGTHFLRRGIGDGMVTRETLATREALWCGAGISRKGQEIG